MFAEPDYARGAGYCPLFDLNGHPYQVIKYATNITMMERECPAVPRWMMPKLPLYWAGSRRWRRTWGTPATPLVGALAPGYFPRHAYPDRL